MPTDRDGAALLAAASAEDLERWADALEIAADWTHPGTSKDGALALAALARAVAKMERGLHDASYSFDAQREVLDWTWRLYGRDDENGERDDDAKVAEGKTFPAALASLLGGAR